jgi:hypothetical protein
VVEGEGSRGIGSMGIGSMGIGGRTGKAMQFMSTRLFYYSPLPISPLPPTALFPYSPIP